MASLSGTATDMPPAKDIEADTRAEQVYQRQVRLALPLNYPAHLAHGLLGQTGFRLVNAPTFMPAFVLLLAGGSSFAIGLCLSLQAFGQMLSPFLAANMVEHRKQVLPAAILSGIFMRSMVLCIALTAFWLEPPWALWTMYLLMLLLGLSMGMQGVIFNFLIFKLIPVKRRGRLTGLRNFLAGITTAIVAWLAGEYMLGDVPTATGYGQTFLLAFVLTAIGLLLLALVREPAAPNMRSSEPLLSRLREVPPLLRQDPAFARYIVARSIATMGRMAVPFYIVYAGAIIGISGQTLGTLTFVFTLSATISNLIWGSMADRLGFRFVMLSSIALWVLSTLLLFGVSDLTTACLAFIGIGASFQGFQNSSINMTLEFGKMQDLPMRIALANSLAEMSGAIGPIVGGLLAVQFSYQLVFWVSIGFLVLGGMMIWRNVPEPRRQRNLI